MKEEGDFDFDFKKSKNLLQVSLSEGRGEVSVMKVEGDFILLRQCKPRMGGGCETTTTRNRITSRAFPYWGAAAR
jgi:hypothetical protein